MTTYYLQGTQLVEGAEFTVNGFTYPYSWLENASPSIRASLGIEKIGEIVYDQKYYWSKDQPKNLEDQEDTDTDGNPVFIKEFDASANDGFGGMVDTDKRQISIGLKTICATEIKVKTNELLKPTDFYIIRNAVEEIEIPESVSAYRSAVVAESARLQSAISTVESVEELIEVMNSIDFPSAR